MNKIISFWKIVLSFGWAKSGTWSNKTDKEERIYLISLHLLKRDEATILHFFIGPIVITIGIV